MVSDIIRSYAEAAIPETYTVLGVRLQALSLGHVILMQRHQLPWVSNKAEDPSIWALIYGVLICSKSWQEYHEWVKSPNNFNWIQSKISSFVKNHDKLFKYEFLRKYYYDKWENDIRDFTNMVADESDKDKSFNIMQKIMLFDRYMRAHQKYPRFFIKEHDGQPGVTEGNPNQWVENVLVTLCGKLGYDREKVLNMPLSNALYDYLKYAEENDLIEFDKVDSDEIDAMIKLNTGRIQNATT